eukprot:CAMPEP_0172511142 /NCGR_PEP_ID=MMETSP1066-20121228/234098_1 /TAXON_ID=671091 /ORGANISM="Coscinodiscus wailesii, Strain CCMP2513" /LENGTH=40 /DNA_ID= /DNA_START= /DNA_END= /DNA_ORIENTATION=
MKMRAFSMATPDVIALRNPTAPVSSDNMFVTTSSLTKVYM